MQRIFVRDVNKQFKYFYVVFLVQVISKLAVLWGIISRTVNVWSGAVLQQQLYGTCKWRYVYKNITFHIKTRRLINIILATELRLVHTPYNPFFWHSLRFYSLPCANFWYIKPPELYIYLFIYLFIFVLLIPATSPPHPTFLYLYINKIQRDVTVCRCLFTAKLLYMFRVSIAPIIRSTSHCNWSFWYRS